MTGFAGHCQCNIFTNVLIIYTLNIYISDTIIYDEIINHKKPNHLSQFDMYYFIWMHLLMNILENVSILSVLFTIFLILFKLILDISSNMQLNNRTDSSKTCVLKLYNRKNV